MKTRLSLFIIAVFAISSMALLQGCADAEPSGTITSVPVGEETTTTEPSVEEPAAPESAAGGTMPTSTLSVLLNNPGYQAFLSLKAGMTKEEVDGLLGAGTRMETDTFDGAGTEKFEYTKDGQVMWISFRDGKLMSKGGKENKDWTAPITAEQFAQVKNDMSLDEVVALFGEGQLLNENHQYAESLGEIGKTYFWNVDSGYKSVTIMFKNDKVSYISDMNMD